MSDWPKCEVCKREIGKGQVFVVSGREPQVVGLQVSHEGCVSPEQRIRPKRMNDARAWACLNAKSLEPRA